MYQSSFSLKTINTYQITSDILNKHPKGELRLYYTFNVLLSVFCSKKKVFSKFDFKILGKFSSSKFLSQKR